jgi:hypothetical protein
LPTHPALLGNSLDMAITLGWIGFGRWTEHGRRARRHDNRSFRRVPGYSIINPILVVGAVEATIVPVFASTSWCNFLHTRRR